MISFFFECPFDLAMTKDSLVRVSRRVAGVHQENNNFFFWIERPFFVSFFRNRRPRSIAKWHFTAQRCEVVRNKRCASAFVTLFFCLFLCTGFATIRRLAQQLFPQGSGFFWRRGGFGRGFFVWPRTMVTHNRWIHVSFKCFSPSLQSIFHRSNNLLLRYRSHSRYLSHFQRIHLAWGRRFELHSQTILLLGRDRQELTNKREVVVVVALLLCFFGGCIVFFSSRERRRHTETPKDENKKGLSPSLAEPFQVIQSQSFQAQTRRQKKRNNPAKKRAKQSRTLSFFVSSFSFLFFFWPTAFRIISFSFSFLNHTDGFCFQAGERERERDIIIYFFCFSEDCRFTRRYFGNRGYFLFTPLSDMLKFGGQFRQTCFFGFAFAFAFFRVWASQVESFFSFLVWPRPTLLLFP